MYIYLRLMTSWLLWCCHKSCFRRWNKSCHSYSLFFPYLENSAKLFFLDFFPFFMCCRIHLGMFSLFQRVYLLASFFLFARIVASTLRYLKFLFLWCLDFEYATRRNQIPLVEARECFAPIWLQTKFYRSLKQITKLSKLLR